MNRHSHVWKQTNRTYLFNRYEYEDFRFDLQHPYVCSSSGSHCTAGSLRQVRNSTGYYDGGSNIQCIWYS